MTMKNTFLFLIGIILLVPFMQSVSALDISENLTYHLNSGDSKIFSFELKNNESKNISNINLFSTVLSEYIIFTTNNLTINENSSTTINFNITVPLSHNPNIFTGKFLITSTEPVYLKPVSIEIMQNLSWGIEQNPFYRTDNVTNSGIIILPFQSGNTAGNFSVSNSNTTIKLEYAKEFELNQYVKMPYILYYIIPNTAVGQNDVELLFFEKNTNATYIQKIIFNCIDNIMPSAYLEVLPKEQRIDKNVTINVLGSDNDAISEINIKIIRPDNISVYYNLTSVGSVNFVNMSGFGVYNIEVGVKDKTGNEQKIKDSFLIFPTNIIINIKNDVDFGIQKYKTEKTGKYKIFDVLEPTTIKFDLNITDNIKLYINGEVFDTNLSKEYLGEVFVNVVSNSMKPFSGILTFEVNNNTLHTPKQEIKIHGEFKNYQTYLKCNTKFYKYDVACTVVDGGSFDTSNQSCVISNIPLSEAFFNNVDPENCMLDALPFSKNAIDSLQNSQKSEVDGLRMSANTAWFITIILILIIATFVIYFYYSENIFPYIRKRRA